MEWGIIYRIVITVLQGKESLNPTEIRNKLNTINRYSYTASSISSELIHSISLPSSSFLLSANNYHNVFKQMIIYGSRHGRGNNLISLGCKSWLRGKSNASKVELYIALPKAG